MKSVVGVGLLLGVTATSVTTAGALPSDLNFAPTGDLAGVDTARAATLVGDRTQDRASRSSSRAELSAARADTSDAPAVTAPAAGKDATSTYGVLAMKAVAKPEPKPEPAPAPEPTATSSATPSSAPGPDSKLMAEAQALGLGYNASRVYVAVRTQFPALTNIGGYRAGDPGDHGTGRAVDVMCTGSTGDAVVAYLQPLAAELNITYIIWEQRIWYPGSNTWELMEDRGSITANHYDHVHISVE